MAADGGENVGDWLGAGDALTVSAVLNANLHLNEASTSKLDGEITQEETRKNVNAGNPMLSMIHTELVADKLLTFLNFEDMKALSAVSADCLQVVRKTKQFSDRAKLIICKEIINLGILRESTYFWKHLYLDLSLPDAVVGLIDDILESAESLVLRLPCAIEDNDLVSYLGNIFRACKKLEYLDLDVFIMSKVLHDIFSDVDIQAMLSKLKGLNIHGYPTKTESVCYIDGSEDDGETPFQRNFLQLSMLPLQLTGFVFGKVIPVSGSEADHVKFIPNIVEAIKDTVEDLALHLHVWKYDEMKGIRCPKLKRLTLSAYGKQPHAKIVETFLINQPHLEELVIEMKGEFPVSILLAIEKMLSKMKKLHLKMKRFTGSSDPVDWHFLESMSELKDFSIRKVFGWDGSAETFGSGEDILIKLPTSVQKIALQGFDYFWSSRALDAVNNIGLALGRFENLTELNLLRSKEAVSDDGLQGIITNCPSLTALTFSHCPNVGTSGLTGIFEDWDGQVDTGRSLKDLKGLTHLKIRSCPNITPESILSAVQFPCLRSFDYYKNIELPREFLCQIVKQNPCLEYAAVHIRSYDNDPDYINSLRKEIKELNPRVHQIKTLEQSNWEDEDSDSDASSINDGEDSDFSGGGYRGGNYADFDEEYDDSPDDYFDDDDGEGLEDDLNDF